MPLHIPRHWPKCQTSVKESIKGRWLMGNTAHTDGINKTGREFPNTLILTAQAFTGALGAYILLGFPFTERGQHTTQCNHHIQISHPRKHNASCELGKHGNQQSNIHRQVHSQTTPFHWSVCRQYRLLSVRSNCLLTSILLLLLCSLFHGSSELGGISPVFAFWQVCSMFFGCLNNTTYVSSLSRLV